MGDLGFDPNMDPELAMALRLSMEEANAAAAQNQPSQPEPANPEPSQNVQPGLESVAEVDYYDADGDDGQEDDEKAL